MAALKVSLAAAVGAFTVASPAAVALGVTGTTVEERVEGSSGLRSFDELALMSVGGAADDQGDDAARDARSLAPDAASGKGEGNNSAAGSSGVSGGSVSEEKVPSGANDDGIDNGFELPDANDDVTNNEGMPSFDVSLFDVSELNADALMLDEAQNADEEIMELADATVSDQTSLENALAALGSSGTITLGGSFTVSGPVTLPSGANVVIALNGKTLTGTGSSVFCNASGTSLTVAGPGTVRATGGDVFDGGATLGSLNVSSGVTMIASQGGKVFGGAGDRYQNASIATGCRFGDSSAYGFLRGDQVFTYTNGMYIVQDWPDPDSECWYAMALPVYCLTESDFEQYMRLYPGTDIVVYPDIEYTVTFKAGSNAAVLKTATVYRGHCVGSKACADGAAPTDEQIAAATPAGKTFEGWLDAKGKLHSTQEICALPVTGDTTYTAKYSDAAVYHDVAFVFGADQTASQTKTLAEGQPIEPPNAAATALSNYKMLGWYDAKVDGNRICDESNTQAVKVTGATTLYAHYKYVGDYEVTLVVDYPTGSERTTASVAADSKLVQGQLPKLKNIDGYEFDSWHVKSNGSSADIGLSGSSVDSQIENPCTVPVTQPMLFTASFKKVDKPVGPVDPNPPVGPVDPDPIDPDPEIPTNPTPTPLPGDGMIGGLEEESVTSTTQTDPREPHAPATPWNPPGLTLAAGFTVPASGPGVEVRDMVEPTTTGEGGGGDGDDFSGEPSAFDGVSTTEGGFALIPVDLAVAAGLAGVTALAAVMASKIAAFFAANATAAESVAAGLGAAGASAAGAAAAAGGASTSILAGGRKRKKEQ